MITVIVADTLKNSSNTLFTLSFKKFGIIIILLLAVAISVALMSRSRESGHSYITDQVKTEVQITGRDPCDILSEWLADAKSEEDTQLVQKIKQAQKYFECRNRQKRQGG